MTIAPPAEVSDPISGNADLPAIEKPPRIIAVDAMRGFVMLTMIYVNDLAGSDYTPWWMKHYSDTGFGPNGMTFVDLVFPSFIFLVGMSIPLAFTSRLARGVPAWKLAGHVLLRTLSLLIIGIMMVNTEERPNDALMPIRHGVWEALLYVFAILAFCQIGWSTSDKRAKIATWGLRAIGGVGLLYLALVYRWGTAGRHLLSLHPLYLHHSWYGILGLIGWAYLIAAVVFAMFRTRRLPILTCIALLYTLFALDKGGAFDSFRWFHFFSFGENGTHGAIAVSGLLLGSILLTTDTASPGARVRFAAWFVLGFAAAALIVAPPLRMFKEHPPLWVISKNEATPPWGLWSAAAAGAVWLVFYLIADVWRITWLAKPWAVVGQNVLLAYLLSEGLVPWLHLAHLRNWYVTLGEPDLTHAICRALGCGAVLLGLTAVLNRIGFSVRL